MPSSSSSNNKKKKSNKTSSSSSFARRQHEQRQQQRQRQAAEDEAYAQALQDEYRKDFLRRQANKNNNNKKSNKNGNATRKQRPSSNVATTTTVRMPPPPAVASATAPTEDMLRTSTNTKSIPHNAFATTTTTVPQPSAPPSYAMNQRSQTLEDERYARQLQAQLQSSNNNGNGNSHDDYYNNTNTTPHTFNIGAPYVNPTNVFDTEQPSNIDTKLAQELQDEEYARRLQNQVLKEENNRRNRRSSSQQQQRNQRQQEQAPTTGPTIVTGTPVPNYNRSSSHFMDERTNSTLSDEATARRIQQELQDADYAQRLSVLEQQEAQAMQLQQQERNAQTNQRKSCTVRRCIPLFICASVIAIVPLLFVLGVFNPSDIPILDDIFGDDWIGGDPWSGNTTGLDGGGPTPGSNPYAWSNTGNGLTLEILNACSDEWQPFVNEAIANWDAGSPIDSLSFRTTRIQYESFCSDVRGKLKICNGNYGDTRWRGLNEVLLSPRQNIILSSTAKLNEYYLSRESDAQKLYTACHELGHGFGLPHWDENFFNRDLGNCMDYTQNPSRNSKPDESNFLYLAQLYGGRNVTAEAATSSSTTTAIEESVPPSSDDGNTRRRYLRRWLLPHQEEPTSQLLDVLPFHPKRRILHADDVSEHHMLYHNDGSRTLQQFLLALPNER